MNNAVSIIPWNKKEEKNIEIHYSFYETAYGLALVASTRQGICYVGFGDKDRMLASLRKKYPRSGVREQESDCHKSALDYIRNQKVPELPLHVSGTDFQLRVWKALLQIPLGELSSYREIAHAVNRPKAVRAVGSAIGDNPVSYIIPCHRVIRSDGGLGGYYWGLDIKKKMIEKETKGGWK